MDEPRVYPRVWGISVGKNKNNERTFGLIEDEDFWEYEDAEDDAATATTADSTAVDDMTVEESDSDEESANEDFEAENLPRPPPTEMLYGGQGTSTTRSSSALASDGERGRKRMRPHQDTSPTDGTPSERRRAKAVRFTSRRCEARPGADAKPAATTEAVRIEAM